MHPDHEVEQFYTRSHLPGVPRPFHQLEPEERIDWAKRMEKAQFEAWAKRHHYDLVRCSHEPYAAYRSDLTNAALAGWRGGKNALEPFEYEGGCTAEAPSDLSEDQWIDLATRHANADWHSADSDGYLNTVKALCADYSASIGTTRPTDDQLWDQTLRERDSYHDWADRLANGIAARFGVDIGEHSNVNNPWQEALEVIGDADAPPAFEWPPLPEFPESFARVAGHAYFTGRQMMDYANAYGKTVRATAPQADHYQQLLGVAYVVLGCLAANGVDIPVRFLDAFSDPDSVENPLELLPCDFSPAQAVRAAVEAAKEGGC